MIRTISKPRPGLLVLVLLGTAIAGCERTARDLSLDEPQARDACKSVLVAWQAGKSAEELKPGIIASDYAWADGKTLVAFDFLPGESSDGTNLHIPVKLTLADDQGNESTSKATYVVGTSPVVTVIRD